MTSKITSVAVASVVAIMVGVVITASLGTQDDVSEATDPQTVHAPSEMPDTVNETSVTLVEPQGNTSQATNVVNGSSDTMTEPQDIASQTTEPPTQSEEFGTVDIVVDKDMTKSNLPKVVDVGLMVMEWDTIPYNERSTMAILGMNNFNNYLEEIGAPWRMDIIEKNLYDPIVALEMIQQLDSEGVKFVVGPIPSTDIHHIKSYVDSNDMMLISSWSSATSLAVVDNIFRFAPDDNQQGNVLSLLFEQEGIEAVIPIYSGDDWGDGMYESTKNSFEALGGVMDDGIRYSPEAEASAYHVKASMLSDLVDKYTDQYPVDKVAVLMIGFSETVHLLGSAASFDNLDSVRWFGSYGLSLDSAMADDPAVSTFLQDVDIVGTAFGASRNDVYADVQEHFERDPTPDPYSFPIYDSVWVLGKTILETDSIDPLTVRDSIIDVAVTHTGTIGTINLNEFGDFATPSYGLWSIRDGAWYKSGYFDADSGTFSFT